MHRLSPALAALAGALGPLALAIAGCSVFGAGPVLAMASLTWAAALNALSPGGGGMVVEGTYRTRLLWQEWTHDVDRDPKLRALAPFVLALATSGPFIAAAPVHCAVLRLVAPLRPGVAEVLLLAGVAALLITTLLRNGREAPLWKWRREVDGGAPVTPSQLAVVARLAQPSGAVGHVGGIGARTPGLHEHLDAERLLRAAEPDAVARRLRARALDYLASQALPDGGFPIYPGGGGRLVATARAVEALGDRLTPADRERHVGFVRRCVSGDGFGRSPGQPADAESTAAALRVLGDAVHVEEVPCDPSTSSG